MQAFDPRIVFESSNIETVQSLVAAGMGIAFVPKMMTRAKCKRIYSRLFAISCTMPSRTLVIASRKGRYLSKAAEAFIETMKTTVENHFSINSINIIAGLRSSKTGILERMVSTSDRSISARDDRLFLPGFRYNFTPRINNKGMPEKSSLYRLCRSDCKQ